MEALATVSLSTMSADAELVVIVIAPLEGFEI